MSKPPLVVPTTTRRDIILGAVMGVLVLAFLVFGILQMGKTVETQVLRGRIVEKHFVPQAEEQITIGKGGMRTREIDGEYTFDLEVPAEKRTYKVFVDKTVYEAYRVGEEFTCPRPPAAPSS